MWKMALTKEKAINLIQRKKKVDINFGFSLQLDKWERILKKEEDFLCFAFFNEKIVNFINFDEKIEKNNIHYFVLINNERIFKIRSLESTSSSLKEKENDDVIENNHFQMNSKQNKENNQMEIDFVNFNEDNYYVDEFIKLFKGIVNDWNKEQIVLKIDLRKMKMISIRDLYKYINK